MNQPSGPGTNAGNRHSTGLYFLPQRGKSVTRRALFPDRVFHAFRVGPGRDVAWAFWGPLFPFETQGRLEAGNVGPPCSHQPRGDMGTPMRPCVSQSPGLHCVGARVRSEPGFHTPPTCSLLACRPWGPARAPPQPCLPLPRWATPNPRCAPGAFKIWPGPAILLSPGQPGSGLHEPRCPEGYCATAAGQGRAGPLGDSGGAGCPHMTPPPATLPQCCPWANIKSHMGYMG